MPTAEQVAKCKTINELLNLDGVQAELYDETPTDTDYALKLNPYLTDDEIDDARFWYHFSRGLLFIHGPPGSGKGLLGNMILKKMRWYYDKNILLDYKPRRLFAQEYMPLASNMKTGFPEGEARLMREKPYILFNRQTFVEQLSRMGDVALGSLADDQQKDVADLEKKKAKELQKLTGQWVSTQGEVFFKYAALGIDEVKRYHDKRRPHNPFGLLLDDLYNIYRHLDLLIVAMSAYYDELDTFRFLNKVNYEIRCTWANTLSHTSLASLYPKVSIDSSGVKTFMGKKIPLYIDGRMPREVLGNYVTTTLAADIDEKATVIQLADTTGFELKKGVLWLDKEYIGYERAEGNILTGCKRGLNRRRNHCIISKHKAGESAFTGKGWFDIFNSLNAIAIAAPKSMRG